MTVRLEELLAAATPGPWKVLEEGGCVECLEMGDDDFIQTDGGYYGPNAHNAALIALSPEMARLLIDMGAELENIVLDIESFAEVAGTLVSALEPARALLARLDRLGNTT